MLPVSRAAFPPPAAANDHRGLVRWAMPAPRPAQRRGVPWSRLLLPGLLLTTVLSLLHWAAPRVSH